MPLPSNMPPPPPQIPQNVPTQIQTANASQAQQFTSGAQGALDRFNQANAGKGVALRSPASTQPTSTQNMQNARNAAQNSGKVARGIRNAKNQSNINRERNNALSGRQPGYTDRPTSNKGITNARSKAGGSPPSAKGAQTSQNKGIATARSKSAAKQGGASSSQPSKSASLGAKSTQSKAGGASRSSGASSGKSGGGQSR